MPLPRSGHFPGHLREAFCNAIEAFMTWDDGEPEPTVDVEFNWEPRPMPVSKVCGLLWNCSDILPGHYCSWLEYADIELRRRTYAAAAREMHRRILIARVGA